MPWMRSPLFGRSSVSKWPAMQDGEAFGYRKAVIPRLRGKASLMVTLCHEVPCYNVLANPRWSGLPAMPPAQRPAATITKAVKAFRARSTSCGTRASGRSN
ncbi:hypothetical protein D3C84_1080070 [compost metagenome]